MGGKCNISSTVELLLISVMVIVAIVPQWLLGDFPVELFGAPLNIIVLLLCMVCTVELYRRRATSHLAQYLLSMRATWLSLLLMVVVALVLGLQREPASESWGVVVAMLFVLTHLQMVIMRGWRSAGGVRWRFVFNHVGLWLALAAGYYGAADREQLRVVVERDATTSVAYDMSGVMHTMEYELQLKEFTASYYDNGTPSHFEAHVAVDGDVVPLKVNHPYMLTWSDTLYLVSYDSDTPCKYCVVELVSEPWRWLTMLGIVMLIVGAVLMFLRGPQRVTTEKYRCER